MDEFEAKLSQILSDPASMAQIMGIAQQLMGQSPGAADSPASSQTAPPLSPPSAGEAAAPPTLPPAVTAMLHQAEAENGREAALFNALKPFLKPNRREKIDKAMRVARISHLAGYAIRNLDF